jgi:cation:H+ antiporter
MGSLNSPVLLALFIVSAGVIWIAGIKLSNTTDVLAEGCTSAARWVG